MTVDQLHGLQAGEEIDPYEQPELANMLGRMAMDDSNDEKPTTLIELPPDGSVTLPGGWLDDEGTVHRDAVVRELTGQDEEELSRPSVARDYTKRVDTLLNRCVVTIGGEAANRAILDMLLIGDRDMLLQAIRVASYGDTMRLNAICPHCQEPFQVDYTFSADVPVREIDGREITLDEHTITLDAARHIYPIPLKRGRVAQVALVDGGMQRSIYTAQNDKLSIAELNTLLLKQTVQSVDGMPVTMTDIRNLPSADRLRILTFLMQAQPGPQWGEVKHSCPRCEREFPLVIDVDTMFRGF